MAAQQLQNPAQLEWVQRQLRGQRPKHLVEAGEKLGLQLKRLQVTWRDLRQLSFPALLHWEQEHWVVVYGRSVVLVRNRTLRPIRLCNNRSLP